MKIFSRIVKAPLAAGAIMGLSGMVASAIVAPAPAYAYVQPIWLNVNQSYYLSTQTPIARVAVASPDIADVIVLSDNAVNIVANGKAGTTTVNVWTKNGMRQEFKVVVSQINDGLAEQIKKAINLPHVEVVVVGNRVLLKGYVNNQYEKELAFRIAALYIGDFGATQKNSRTKNLQVSSDEASGETAEIESEEQVVDSNNVVNLLQMINPDQINIEALVLEINSDEAQKLGVTYNGTDTSTAGEFTVTADSDRRSKRNHWYTRNWLYTNFSKINATINLLVENGKARVISRPNITTMSGKSAGILVGGEIPYQSVDGNGNIDTEYKPYGISLTLANPIVDQNGNITSKVNAKVSRIDWTNAITQNGYRQPALTTRTAETVVNIPSGMTMAIGGLLDSEDTKSIQKVPLLGDIPLLGELFKYHNDSKQKSEIMILITPRVVNETTMVRMNDKMQDAYYDMRRDDEARKEVDLNGPIPPKPVEVEEKAPEAQPTIKERTDAILAEERPVAPNDDWGVFSQKAREHEAKLAQERAEKQAAESKTTASNSGSSAPVSLW